MRHYASAALIFFVPQHTYVWKYRIRFKYTYLFYIFILDLFTDDFNSSDHIAPDGRMVSE
jgi:hypothetical protein